MFDPASATFAASIDFLKALRLGGPWTLTAIFPVKGPPTITKSFSDEQSATDFIRRYNVDHNVYYSVNPLKSPNAAQRRTLPKSNTFTLTPILMMMKVQKPSRRDCCRCFRHDPFSPA